MRFIFFRFQNFKGITSLEIDFRKNPNAKVYPIIGLNESGKTTILEAINTFKYKPESLVGLIDAASKEIDFHDLIPISKRDNFRGYVKIEAGIEFDQHDRQNIKAILEKETGLIITDVGTQVVYAQKYFFENSVHDEKRDLFTWEYGFKGRPKKGRVIRKLENEEALKASTYVRENVPSILYFPNFLFEFPEKIYLEESVDDPKHKFYRKIIQDILDSIGNDLKVDVHLSDRIKADDVNSKRNLNSVIGKMNKKLTDVIFQSWNQIFGKQISSKEIVLFYGVDDEGAYLEFNVQDNVDTYRIFERSLGFRWFFVFLLFTQFRTYRRQSNQVLFLLDEPASNLHPSAQTQLLKSFAKLSRVIYTTHSHYLINPEWLENTFVVKNQAIDYDNEEEYDSKQTNISVFKYRDFASRFPSQTSYFQPILEILDYKPSNLELVPDVVITEGKNDFYLLRYFQLVINEKGISTPVVPGTSATNLDTLIALYLGWARNFIVLLDSDKEGIKQKERYLDCFGLSLQSRIFTYSDIDANWDKMELEDLVDEKDRLALQKLCYPDSDKWNKKVFHRSVQELFVKQDRFEFSKSSKANLLKVCTFLNKKLKQSA